MGTEDVKGLGLRQQALAAAYSLCKGDLTKTFTAEELLVEAWKCDHSAWGLRGHEDKYPDAEKINKELNRRGEIGLVGQGLLQRVDQMVYRLTVAGLHEACSLKPTDAIVRQKADRELEASVKAILEHPAFKHWLSDPSKPRYFREAGHFWGIAPGTPARTVKERVLEVERVLKAARELLDQRGVSAIAEQRGKLLFERQDIERCMEFQRMLRTRFNRDLRILAPEMVLVGAEVGSAIAVGAGEAERGAEANGNS
jgi:hypothetical protein